MDQDYGWGFATDDHTEAHRLNVDKVLVEVGKFMGWKDSSHVFVSDQSTIGDFMLGDGQIRDIGVNLNVEIHPDDYIWQIAAKMNKPV